MTSIWSSAKTHILWWTLAVGGGTETINLSSGTTEGLIMNSSQRGLQDGVDRFGSHVNKLSQDESGCWRAWGGGGGGGEDEGEEELWSEPEVSSLSLQSACDPIIILKILSWALKVQRNKSELASVWQEKRCCSRNKNTRICADYWREPASLNRHV